MHSMYAVIYDTLFGRMTMLKNMHPNKVWYVMKYILLRYRRGPTFLEQLTCVFSSIRRAPRARDEGDTRAAGE